MEWARVMKLNNSNYPAWSFSVTALLRREQLWKYVDPGVAPDPVTDAWREGDEKTLATIQLLVDESQYNVIRDKVTAKTTWDALKEHHNKTSLGQKVTLLKQITNQNYKVGDDMEAYLAGIQKNYARLESSGFEMSECLKVALILRGLPDSFNPLTTALEARDEDDLTLEMVRVKLIDEADKQRKHRAGTDEQALRVGSSRQQQKSVTCYYCQKQGHRKNNCKAFLAERSSEEKNTKKKAKEKAKTVRENDEESFTFMVRSNIAGGASAWLVDSGATSHLANDKSLFVRLDKSARPAISAADGKMLRTEGIGDCSIQCVNDRGENVSVTLTDVIFAPELECNLVSVAKLSNKGVRVEFDDEKCKLVYGTKVVAVADKVGGLYRLNLAGERSMMVNSGQHTKECLHTWHRRLGHRDPAALKEMERKKLVSGVCVRECGIRTTCECCMKAKMARPPFPQVAEKTSKEVLDIVHSDVCGPMTVTPGGCKYYMTMTDDHSRYTVVYFLKEKSEVDAKIREYVRFTENQLGKKPKAIRSDRGGEYTSNSLRKFYTEEGIKPEFTAGYAPQQNGVSERKNRTLNEMGLCMLLDAGLPRRFWAEAVNTAAFIHNRVPSRAVDKTPFELWFGRKPDLSGMKIFGCTAYAWIPPQKRKKFDDKAEKLTFVGYSSEHKAYRLLDVRTGRIVISRDVRFVEFDDEVKEVKNGPTHEAAGNDVDEETPEVNQGLNREVAKCEAEEEVMVRLENHSGQDVESDDEFFGFDDDEVFQGFETLFQEEQAAIPVPEDASGGLRQSTRSNFGVPPVRFGETIGLAAAVVGEPRNYAEAMASPESNKWQAAMAEEMASLQENGTWKLEKLPPGRRAIGSKWVFKRKEDATGNVVRFKARLVAQGFCQKFGSEYDQIFAPVVRQTTFRTVLTLASSRKMLTRHVDIKTAYLYGELQEEIFMRQPPGYESEDPSAVCHLKRSLYGLKQAARVWNQKIDAVLKEAGFQQSKADPCLYSKQVNGHYVYVLLYVDDLIVACHTEQEYQALLNVLRRNFKITELGDLTCFLGIQVREVAGGFVLNQKSYINKTLVRFGMEKANTSRVPMSSGYLQQQQEESVELGDKEQYQSLIGALLYIATNSRPDIAIATSILGRRVSAPTKADWIEAKKVLRYLKGTINDELHLGADEHQPLECFVDADWAGEVSDRKSNTGFLYKFGGGLIQWCCRKQTSVALSSTEAEYIALADSLQELQWLRKLMVDLGVSVKYPVVVREDNQSCIALTATDRSSRRSKHIDTKYCFVKDLVASGVVSIVYCPTDRMEADILTKPLAAVKLQELRTAIGVKSTEVEEEC